MLKTIANSASYYKNALLLGTILALFNCFLVFITYHDIGITWDEPYYMQSGILYANWIQNPDMNSIDAVWGLTDKHPPLGKIPGGISYKLLHDNLQILEPITAFRTGGLLFVFLLTLSIFLFMYQYTNRLTAICTVVLLSLLPRFFFEAHLATLDYPLTTLWVLGVLTYIKGVNSKKWLFLSCLLTAFALLIKLSAVFLLFSLLLYGLYFPFTKRSTSINHAIKDALGNVLPLIFIPPVVYLSL